MRRPACPRSTVRTLTIPIVLLAALSLAARAPSGGTISINEAAPYRFGQRMTFTVSAPGVASPFVVNECFQGGVRVYSEVHGMWPGALYGSTFTLGPTSTWTGGDADCTAKLDDQSRKRPVVLAEISFHVYG